MSPSFSIDAKRGKALDTALYEAETYESAITNRLIALERFETILGAHNHDDVTYENPTPLVSHHLHSETVRDSIRGRRIRELIKYKVPQKSNSSIKELLSMHPEDLREIILECRLDDYRKNANVDDYEAQLKALQGAIPRPPE